MSVELEQVRFTRVFDGHIGGLAWSFAYNEHVSGLHIPGQLKTDQDSLHIDLFDYHSYPDHLVGSFELGLGRTATRAMFNSISYAETVVEAGIYMAMARVGTRPGTGQLALLDNELEIVRH